MEVCSSANQYVLVVTKTNMQCNHFESFLASFQVDVCKQAYNQEDLEDENECEVSCRDVGHNIFILAHQVLLFIQIFLRRKQGGES